MRRHDCRQQKFRFASLRLCVFAFIVPAAEVRAQAPAPAKAPPAAGAVDGAVDRACDWLRKQSAYPPADWNAAAKPASKEELVLYTLLYGGVSREDPKAQALLKSVLERPLERTYVVSLRAMALEAWDAGAHQVDIAKCAQFLVDNQCANGQWSYGEPTDLAHLTETTAGGKKPAKTTAAAPGKPVSSGTASGTSDVSAPSAPPAPSASPKPPPAKAAVSKALKRMVIQRRRPGQAPGDNSNSQYAMLGLRACLQAGVVLAAPTVPDAEKWWAKCQNGDGGWGYNDKGGDYRKESYASMTEGGVGGLIIALFFQNKPYKLDVRVIKGIDWIAKHFDATKNAEMTREGRDTSAEWVYYHLYAMERAGILFGTESFGPKAWYAEGAEHLLKTQNPDGSWGGGGQSDPVTSTCYAVLFLRRATKALPKVYTPPGR